ncbi:uncharacterized protein LOC128732885 [Sabethes cyaneus]|nr:uncharacterized protein LOC128732885 [Sabethes cyaneus]
MVESSADALNADYTANVLSVQSRLGDREPRYHTRYSNDRNRVRSRSRDRQVYRRDHDRERSERRQSSRGRYANFICNFCKLKGHIQKNCYRLKNQQNGRSSVKFVEDTQGSGNVPDYFKRLRIDYNSDSDSPDLDRISLDLGPQGAD